MRVGSFAGIHDISTNMAISTPSTTTITESFVAVATAPFLCAAVAWIYKIFLKMYLLTPQGLCESFTCFVAFWSVSLKDGQMTTFDLPKIARNIVGLFKVPHSCKWDASRKHVPSLGLLAYTKMKQFLMNLV